MNLERLQSRSLSLPRAVSTAMRDSLRRDPTKALRYGQLVEHLADWMTKAYALGYRKRPGGRLTRESLAAKRAEYKRQARQVLTGYQVSANAELKQTYKQARARKRTHRQATQLVLRRFRTLGMDAPASNRMASLYYTATNAAYNQGVWDSDRLDPAIWGFRYLTAGDDRVRNPTHTQYHGVTLPKEHPFWQRTWPPIDWRCRCRIKSLKRKQKIVLPPPNPVPIESGFQGQSFELR